MPQFYFAHTEANMLKLNKLTYSSIYLTYVLNLLPSNQVPFSSAKLLNLDSAVTRCMIGRYTMSEDWMGKRRETLDFVSTVRAPNFI